MKTILLVTSSERSTRILLRSYFFEELKKHYKIVVASMAEQSQQWKDSIVGVQFLNDSKKTLISDALKYFDIKAVISCGNTDTTIHSFDVHVQTEAKKLNIPYIHIQDFLDAIFHPLVIKPDKLIVWGDFFKKIFADKRDVLLWKKQISSIGAFETVDPIEPDIIDVCGPIHFDDYVLREIPSKEQLCNGLQLDKNKLIFSYVPNGEMAEWVFWTFDNFMQSARKFEAQVILKIHPVRHNDSWIFNLISKRYPDVEFRMVQNWSFAKGVVPNMQGYAHGEFHLDYRDSLQLAGILKNSDIVGSMGSTASFESLIFDVPTVIDTSFWSHPWKVREQVMKWLWKVIANYDCCEMVNEAKNLESAIKMNLMYPERKSTARKNIVNDFFNGDDGKNYLRAVESIDGFLNG